MLVIAFLFVIFIFGHISGLYIDAFPSNRYISLRRNCNKLYALSPNADSVLARFKVEYNSLLETSSESDSTSERIKELKVIFDCVEALEKIDNDLALFAEHENGADAGLKKTAQIFTQEFLMCKNQLETQLNNLLK